MSIPAEGQPGGNVVAAESVAPPQAKADDHWPICRCTHPMHPARLEKRRGVLLERFKCPRRRWWNMWHHPYVWQPPRE
jgi:hypothetical protein